jgi:hypothetical protein
VQWEQSRETAPTAMSAHADRPSGQADAQSTHTTRGHLHDRQRTHSASTSPAGCSPLVAVTYGSAGSPRHCNQRLLVLMSTINGLAPTVGTVLQIMPTTGHVDFTAKDGETWSLPLIGWALCVRYVDEDEKVYETEVEPLLLLDEQPTTLHWYRLDFEVWPTYKVRLS